MPSAANVLLPRTGDIADKVKICDFGSAVRLPDVETGQVPANLQAPSAGTSESTGKQRAVPITRADTARGAMAGVW